MLAKKDAIGGSLTIPCGGCTGCRLDRSKDWAVRCMHEAQMHEVNCFVTLTYDDDHKPADGSLQVEHFQKFIRRLRKKHGRKIRYYMCGEYGENEFRPHYHACLFGIDFTDKTLWRERDGVRVYRSKTLERIWPYGFSTVGTVTWQSAAYTARYVMKKVTGQNAEEHYMRADEHGECYQLKPEYTSMSLKPGIGHSWFEAYESDVYPHDEVIVDGKRFKPPRYYDKLLERKNPQLLEELKKEREAFHKLNPMEQAPWRLEAKEKCIDARFSRLHREI